VNIQLPDAYKEILDSVCPYSIIYGGRLGGKTKGTALISILFMLLFPYTDIIVARVSYGSLADSSYSVFQDTINNDFAEYKDQFVFKKSPLRIERVGDAGTIYFIGYGGSNTSRTKSIKTKHPIKVVILEETQELKDKRNLDEAFASFRRDYGEGVRVFILGNPQPQKSHWFWQFIEEKKFDPDYIVRNITWKDIIPFINDYDLKEIIKTKATNNDYYNWFYEGTPNSAFGSVYPMFRPEKHIISVEDWNFVKEKGSLKVVGMVVGGDGAVNRDSTAFVPILLLNNGQSVVFGSEIFYHNPLVDGVISYHMLVQNNLTRWFDRVCRRFNLGTAKEKREHPNMQLLPVWFRIDSAAPDLIQEVKFFLSDRADIQPIKKPHVLEMVGVCQSAIANNNLIIVEEKKYCDYQQNKWVQKDFNLLAEQLDSLIWNEQQNNYDPIVPNDVADAWTYGTYFWYSNQENIQFFNVVKMRGGNCQTIGAILKNKGESYDKTTES